MNKIPPSIHFKADLNAILRGETSVVEGDVVITESAFYEGFNVFAYKPKRPEPKCAYMNFEPMTRGTLDFVLSTLEIAGLSVEKHRKPIVVKFN
jgi:hypothetical protein